MSVRLLRTAKGVGQVELCRKAGVSRFRLSHAERGLIELADDEIARIARALDVPVDAIFPSSGEHKLTIDLLFAGDYAAAVCGPRIMQDGTIQPQRTFELDETALKSLETREGKQALRARLTRIYDAVNAAHGANTEPAEWIE
jgi:transcriptional regulator with XRE-family HTH domain